MATPRTVKERFSRSKTGCFQCRKRKKACDQLFNAQNVCQRCEIGGIECHRDRINSPTLKGTSQFASFNPKHFPSASTSTSASSSSYNAGRTPSASSPTTSVSRFEASSPALSARSLGSSVASFSPPISSQSLPTTLTRPRPPSPQPPAISFAPLKSINPALPPPSDFGAEFFSLFSTTLPPAMPPVGFAWSQVVSDMFEGGRMHVRQSASEARIRELGDEGDEPVDDAQDVNETLTLYAALDDEGFSGFDLRSRSAISDRYMALICDYDVSTAACMAFASGVRARRLPPTATKARARLIAQAAAFYSKALQDLQMGQYPLEAQLIASMDLTYHQIEIYGPSAYYSSLTLTDILLTSALGPRPRPYSTVMQGVLNFLLRGHAYRDVMRALALGNRTTLFDFRLPLDGGSPLPTFTVFGDITIEGESTFMDGLPASMVVFLAEICNLKQEEEVLGRMEFRRRAEALERKIIEWEPLESALVGARLEELEAITTKEMWRCAALINIRTMLYHLGSLHLSIRQALKQLITFGILPPNPSSAPTSSTSPQISPSAVMERAAPWFFAATVAVSDEDRTICRRALEMTVGASRYFAAGNLLDSAERIWELTDTGDGNSIDWRRALEREGRCVSFAWSNA